MVELSILDRPMMPILRPTVVTNSIQDLSIYISSSDRSVNSF